MITKEQSELWRKKKLEYLKKYRVKPENMARHRLAAKKYREANKEKYNAYHRLYNQKKFAEIKLLGAKRHSQRIYTFEYSIENSRKYNRAKRMIVLNHYSNGKPVCKCCGESHIEFLAIDHINGNGAQHRKEVKNIVAWLIKNNFPDGFQILCHNCNIAKGYNKTCPHQKLFGL